MTVLILTSKFGMGHYYAAEAIAEQLMAERPEDKIYVEDFMNVIAGKSSKQLYAAYSNFVAKGGNVYNLIYRHYTEKATEMVTEWEQYSSYAAILEAINPMNSVIYKALKKTIEKRRPDLIISTYSGCNRYIGDYLRKTNSDIGFITCITDIGIHGKWVDSNVDMYMTASEETKQSLIEIGVPAQNIAVTGIPVRYGFKEAQPERAQCKIAGEKNLLIMGGGLGLLPEEAGFYERLDRVSGLKTTVITGKNKNVLKRFAGKYENVEFLSYTMDIDRYIKNADWLLTKPGGITTFEAINAATPLILIKPFLQQETLNGEFVKKHKMGILLEKGTMESIDEIIFAVNDEVLRKRCSYNMRELCEGFNKKALEDYIWDMDCMKSGCADARRQNGDFYV